MNTLDYVKKYQDELSNNKYNSVFNIWAFLFSSLYFLYKRMYVWFAVFFIAPLILYRIFEAISAESNIYLTAFLIIHLIAGFSANPLCKRYLENYIKNHQNADLNKIVSYHSVSVVKLVLFMILSCGLYSLYWGYKHWETYQLTTKDDVSPFARGWLIHLTAPSLFAKIGKSIHSNIQLQYLGIGFLFCALIPIFFDRYFETFQDATTIYSIIVLQLILFLISVLFLAIVQKKINDYNISHSNEKVKITVNIKEIIIVLIGFILFGVLSFQNDKDSYSFLGEYTQEQQEKIGASVGFIYRHTKGYKEVCEKEGYIIKKYPNEFLSYFSHEINQLNAGLSKHNYTIEDVENALLNDSIKTRIATDIYTELEMTRKLFIIMSLVAEEQDVSIENVHWDNNWNNLLTFKDVCEIFDERGIDLLKENENKNFLKTNGL